MDYGTWHEEDEKMAWVYTSPRKSSRVYRYPFHLRAGCWVLSREKEWYTAHALRHAEEEFSHKVFRRHLPAPQTSFDDFDRSEEPESASVVACNSD